MEEERLFKKHLGILNRRKRYLAGKIRNSYDEAELMALNWVIYFMTTPEGTAQSIDSIEQYETVKKIRG